MFVLGLVALLILPMKSLPGPRLFANVELNLQPGKINSASAMQSNNTSMDM